MNDLFGQGSDVGKICLLGMKGRRFEWDGELDGDMEWERVKYVMRIPIRYKDDRHPDPREHGRHRCKAGSKVRSRLV